MSGRHRRGLVAAAFAALCASLVALPRCHAIEERIAVKGCVVHEGTWVRTNAPRHAAALPPPPAWTIPSSSRALLTTLPPPLAEIPCCTVPWGACLASPRRVYPYNSSCPFIDERQRCLGKDPAWLDWEWEPHGCHLPLFDAGRFLELLRNRVMAFVGAH